LRPPCVEYLRERRASDQRLGDGGGGSRFVSDELVDEVTINGTEKDVKEGLDAYVAAGVNLPIIVPFGGERRVLEALAPTGRSRVIDTAKV